MKKLLLVATLSALAFAQSTNVYVTQHGQKYYHTYRDCVSLMRSSKVLTAGEKEAQSHGLTLCPICAHRHNSKTVHNNTENWATPEVKR